MSVGGRLSRWLLLEGDRNAVALVVVAFLFGTLLALHAVGVVALADPDSVGSVAGSLIPGLFTFISIVLAINQLVLSQEFGSADEIRERLAEVQKFRREVETAADSEPSPVVPTAFLRMLVGTLDAHGRDLADAAAVVEDSDRRTAVEAFARDIVDATAVANDTLASENAGRFNAVLSVLTYPDAEQIRRVREFRTGPDLPGEVAATLDRILETLELFHVARTHFRTTYTQRVLARLSRHLLYVGVPGILAAMVLVLAGAIGDDGLGRHPVAVATLLSIALSPLAVLFAYVLRIATVSERTVAVGPFVSRPDRVSEE